MQVGIVVERRRAATFWADQIWRPFAVLPAVPDIAPWSVLEGDEQATRFFVGAATITLHASDTAHYRDNLASEQPGVWVVLRRDEGEKPVRIFAATVNPSEGEGFSEAGDDIVDVVAMPTSIAQHVAAFVAAHHVEREFFKRKQTRADPQALARRTREDRR
jgi:hypothetical protein